MKKCPYCVEEIHESAVKCRHCLEYLKKPPGAPSGDGDGAAGWVDRLPKHLKPPVKTFRSLEAFRKSAGMPPLMMTAAVSATQWATRRLLESTLASVRQSHAGISPEEAWKKVVLECLSQRIESRTDGDIPAAELRRMMRSVDKVVGKCETWDDVVGFLLRLDERNGNRPSALQADLENILNSS